MAANNYFAYPAPHAAAAAAPQPAAAPASAYNTAPPPPPTAVVQTPAAPAAVAAYPAAPPAAASAAAVAAVAAGVQPAAAPAAPVAYATAQPAAAANAVSTAYRAAAQQPTAVVYSAYQPPQNTAATYVAAPAAAAAAPAPAAQATPAAYPAATYDPQYAPQPQAAAVAAAGQIYDPNKTTYYPAAAPPAVPVTANYSAIPSMSDPHYQARPVYTAGSQVGIVARPAAVITAQPRPTYTTYAPTASSAAPYSYAAPPVTLSAIPAVAAAAAAAAPKHAYVQNQPAPTLAPIPTITGVPAPAAMTTKPPVQPWSRPKGPPNMPSSSVGPVSAPPQRAFKTRMPPKPQQLHYCDVCKISCAGPQTYKEHLEGQKHKKKEAALKSSGGGGSHGGGGGALTRGGNALRCELCDVTCTGSDAYAAHIRGSKHQKVVKLHTKLGKPIPSVDPVLITKGQAAGGSESSSSSSAASTSVSKPNPITPIVQRSAVSYPSSNKQPFVPNIKFVSASKPGEPVKTEPKTPQTQHNHPSSSSVPTEVTIPRLPEERDVQPVGHTYIEEVMQDGKVVSFNCKLCDCRFNDPNAKEMHMKGRRHRLQFKKKVNPDLVVDIKPSLRQRKLAEEKAKRMQAKEDFWKRREEEFKMVEEEERAYWEERRKFEEEHAEMFDSSMFGGFRGRFPGGPIRPPMGPPMGPGGPRFGGPMMGPPPFHPHHGGGGPGFMFPGGGGGGPPMLRRPDTVDDRHVMAKHSEIYPTEAELDEIQRAVVITERALKLVSDKLADEDEAKMSEVKKEDEQQPNADRVLKGVMRVGVLAKGLVLRGDATFRLVVLCGEKPTLRLLDRIYALLPSQLSAAEAFIKSNSGEEVSPAPVSSVIKVAENGGLVANFANETGAMKLVQVELSLTSPLMRDEKGPSHPDDILNPEKCLEALASLRHAKWFQARAQGRQSCVLALRILRDFCRRVPTWAPMRLFSLELLVEKVLASAGPPLSPGDAIRRVFEAVAGGVLMPDGPGLLDPCEKEPTDAAATLTNQQRGDITSSAQHALRLIAFRQIHKVLGIEALPTSQAKFGGGSAADRAGRKRRREEASPTPGGEGEVEGEKKDKKDDEDDANEQEGGGSEGAKKE